MAASSNTIDLTGRPPVRRRMSGVLSIDAYRLRSRLRKEGVGAADARNPHHPARPREHGPACATAARHASVLKAADQQPPPGAAERANALARAPGPDHQRRGSEPGGERRPL